MQTHLSRRDLFRVGATAGAGALVLGRTPDAAAATACSPSALRQIKHIIILVQENRSFDHYFGTLAGVRGFDDRTARGGADAFRQAYAQPSTPTGYPNPMLPWHIDTAVSLPPRQGECTNDVEHQWAGQHDAWNNGRNDNWMNSHLSTDPDAKQAAITMGYYTRSDLQFYYSLADNFTICDNYFCSIIAGTDINRLYSMTGTIDPDGWDGGCQFLDTKIGTVQDPGADLGAAGRWVPYPQVLSKAGISWKIYGTPDGQTGDNILRYFPQFRPIGGDPELFNRAFGSNVFPADFAVDCATGRLPQVSWLMASLIDSEHAPAPPEWGESITHSVIAALTTSPVWKDSVLFITYDENGGFFDHVTPVTAPKGTPGEFLSQSKLTAEARAEATTKKGVDLSNQPIGLGYRVPLIVVSPFARNPDPSGGPLVSSERLDHTSLLRFIETWSHAIGRPAPIPNRDPRRLVPGLSAWRRRIVGDITKSLSFGRAPDASVPTALLSVVPNRADPRVLSECIITGTPGSETEQTQPIVQDPDVPSTVPFPTQERVRRRVLRPATTCTSTPSGGGSPTTAPSSVLHENRPLATTGGQTPSLAFGILGLAGAALLALRRRLDRVQD